MFMDESLARGMTNRLTREVSSKEGRIRLSMLREISRFPNNSKGARKAVSLIAKKYAPHYIDFAPVDDGTIARLCVLYGNTDGIVTDKWEHHDDIALALETIEIDHKKCRSQPIGMRIAFSSHAVRRVFQRVKFQHDGSAKFNFTPMYECLRDANIWTQTLLNAMRFGKVIGNADANVNLVIPTRHGAFVGAFSEEMGTVHVRSFLAEDQLGPRVDQWRSGLNILQENQIDLDWVSTKNFSDPRVIAAFILAEDAGLFSVNWNRTNELKTSTLNLEAAAQTIEKISNQGVPVRKHPSKT
jgi:hypothetical protein